MVPAVSVLLTPLVPSGKEAIAILIFTFFTDKGNIPGYLEQFDNQRGKFVNWHRLTLNPTQVATGEAERFRDAFYDAFRAAQAPRTMALFQQKRDDDGLDLFFTPECDEHAAALLSEWGCVACDRPSLLGLQLLVGHNEITYYMP
jgi:hypothetical protein